MGGEAAARKLDPETGPPPERGRPVAVHGGGSPPRGRPPVISRARIGLAIFLGSETMFFTGLLGAYLVLRRASDVWPPPGQPRLPIAVTWANTAVLALSCVAMHRALAALRERNRSRMLRHLSAACLLGMLFLGVQGSEWIRLIGHGLGLSRGVYGATFYVLIGAHGLHVLGAVAWLLLVLARGRGVGAVSARATEIDLAGIYWYYVGALWAVLFPMVYLA